MRRLIRSRPIWISTVCKCTSEFTRCPKLPDFTLMHFCLSFQGCDYSHQLTTKVHRATENPISMEPTPILHSTTRHITKNVLCDINCLHSVRQNVCGPRHGEKRDYIHIRLEVSKKLLSEYWL